MSSSATPAPTPDPIIPDARTLCHAATIAMKEDKPIFLNYFADTKPGGSAFIGVDSELNEKILVRSADEYTSPIKKMYKVKGDIIIETENTIYIVSGGIVTKKITAGAMH